MLAPLPFALHASTGCPSAAELTLSLAGAFHDVDAAVVDARLEAIAERLRLRLRLPAEDNPGEELTAIAGLAASEPLVPVARDEEAIAGLMLDAALDRGAAHPLIRAVVLAEAGRRRGLKVGIVSNGTNHCVAHAKLRAPLLLDAGSGDMVAATTLEARLQWRCSHETSALLIGALEERWLRWSRIDLALRAAELRMVLPFDDDSVERAGARLEHVRAHFN